MQFSAALAEFKIASEQGDVATCTRLSPLIRQIPHDIDRMRYCYPCLRMYKAEDKLAAADPTLVPKRALRVGDITVSSLSSSAMSQELAAHGRIDSRIAQERAQQYTRSRTPRAYGMPGSSSDFAHTAAVDWRSLQPQTPPDTDDEAVVRYTYVPITPTALAYACSLDPTLYQEPIAEVPNDQVIGDDAPMQVAEAASGDTALAYTGSHDTTLYQELFAEVPNDQATGEDAPMQIIEAAPFDDDGATTHIGDVDMCCICMAKVADTMLLPCEHTPCCARCYQLLPQQVCPICRTAIESVVTDVARPHVEFHSIATDDSDQETKGDVGEDTSSADPSGYDISLAVLNAPLNPHAAEFVPAGSPQQPIDVSIEHEGNEQLSVHSHASDEQANREGFPVAGSSSADSQASTLACRNPWCGIDITCPYCGQPPTINGITGEPLNADTEVTQHTTAYDDNAVISSAEDFDPVLHSTTRTPSDSLTVSSGANTLGSSTGNAAGNPYAEVDTPDEMNNGSEDDQAISAPGTNPYVNAEDDVDMSPHADDAISTSRPTRRARPSSTPAPHFDAAAAETHEETNAGVNTNRRDFWARRLGRSIPHNR